MRRRIIKKLTIRIVIMKRVSFFAVLLLLVSSAANSQIDSLPYNVNYPYYYMMHPIDSLRVSSHDGVQCQSAYRTITNAATSMWCGITYSESEKQVALGFYPDTTIHVIGLAFVLWGMDVRQGSVFNHMIDQLQFDRDMHPEFNYSFMCKMYTPYSSTLQLLDTADIRIENLDSEKYRLYQFAVDYNGNVVLWHPFENVSSPSSQHFIFEAFFNSEVDVSDSVYFSVTGHATGNRGLCAWYEYHTPSTSHYNYPPLNYRIADTNATADDPWEFGVTYCYPLMFPIIRRDCDSCPQVRNVELYKGSSTQFFLRWSSGANHRDWQVSYGPAGTAPEHGTILECSQRQTSLITVDPDSHYVAYVRARCRFARDEWGPWSDSVSIWLNQPTDAIEYAFPDIAVTLTPNPAADAVTVTADATLLTLELRDLLGRTVLSQHPSANSATVDVSTLPSGTYILRLHTPQGVATKKLVVK